MTPRLQLTPTSCLQACIATMLDYELDEVPEFSQIKDDPDSKYPVWYLELQSFLARRNYTLIEVRLAGRAWLPLPYETLAIFTGLTKSGVAHSIVGKCDGSDFVPVFDPLGKESIPFEQIESVSFLVNLDPALPIQLGAGLEKVEAYYDAISNTEIRDAIRDIVRAALGKPKYYPPLILTPTGEAAN